MLMKTLCRTVLELVRLKTLSTATHKSTRHAQQLCMRSSAEARRKAPTPVVDARDFLQYVLCVGRKEMLLVAHLGVCHIGATSRTPSGISAKK